MHFQKESPQGHKRDQKVCSKGNGSISRSGVEESEAFQGEFA
ncbi:hypothetical protein T12_12099 [Trichinella patagoniensis]|uniref:Uncharacterized protein n=1 Tax=Trichinella patagoniensis TaxID=990121 RepID=A0A0V0XCW2_9BILA|nr:hypothetical protein T12_12099 [Trichinella patagoniensis]